MKKIEAILMFGFFILLLNACGDSKKEPKVHVHNKAALSKVRKIALITFVANEELAIGTLSYGYEATYDKRPELIQAVSKIFAVNLHDSLLNDTALHDAKISFISLKGVIENQYYQSLKDKFPLKYKPYESSSTTQSIVNALPGYTLYIPLEDTTVFAKLASELGVDAILWIKCDFYLDILDAGGSAPLWNSEAAAETKLFGSEGKLIWEAHSFVIASPKEGVSKSFFRALFDSDERITGETMVSLLQEAVNASVKSVIDSLEVALVGQKHFDSTKVFSKTKSEDKPSEVRRFRGSVGIIPDYTAEVEGMKITGVREGSPAQKTGLQKGDIIIKFGKFDIKNIYDYAYALGEFSPGQKVLLVVKRDSQTLSFNVTLERAQK
ncbi:MAG: PDZ domain-containing protein [Candidatus Bathyarchaeia archaeon]